MIGKAAWNEGLARELIEARRAEKGAMLPILHDLQDRFGYIDSAAISIIAEALNVSKAETLGVVSFYHDYRREPVDGVVLKLCRAESCQAVGCEDLVAHLATAHGLGIDARGGGPLTIETSIASAIARRRRPRCSTVSRGRGSIGTRSTRSSRARGGAGIERANLRLRRFHGARARRRWRRHRLARSGGRARDRCRDHAHGIAGPVLSGADGRGRHTRRPRGLWPASSGRRRVHYSPPAFSTAAPTPSRWDGSRRSHF